MHPTEARAETGTPTEPAWRSVELSFLAAAETADLSENWAWKARDAGLLHAPCGAEDVIALRVYALVVQFPWPGQRRGRNVSQKLELWQTVVVEMAREAVFDPRTTVDTVLWVEPGGGTLVTSPGDRAAHELDRLTGRTAVRLPVGLWVAQLPDAIRAATSKPRRPGRRPAA
ncbi:hypothetical protein BIV57_02025 [Mangrovactinospora gilvigrisea]|uniref:Uncharacterized protein n=1 Tax=Mangrovactinospora gilvigrisea TaxID=1428644 RepID=A0A1J7BKB8_9ACTN|nr:hypothetical protein [Mangrovactinospora gilvigrisea]OIV39131.1 hypothetical protein BIV57_02025 [Mangrovactinospora gilvigrisea]